MSLLRQLFGRKPPVDPSQGSRPSETKNFDAIAAKEQIAAERPTRGAYVYVHKREDGEVFYVGKGRGNRAWQPGRGDLWTQYVQTRASGRYVVEIVADGLSDERALEFEDELIEQYGRQLVNWINSGRQFDYSALNRFHEQRDANKSFISQTRPIEVGDPEDAIRRYREAMRRSEEYNAIEYESGLVADLLTETGRGVGVRPCDDPTALDRLTVVLMRLGRHSEVIQEIDCYFGRYPDSVTENHPVLKRRKAAIDIVEGRAKPKANPVARQPKQSAIDEVVLEKMLQRARRPKCEPYELLEAAKLCRAAGHLQREHDILEELLSGPRVPGRYWLDVEKRLYHVKAILLELDQAQETGP